MKITFPCSIYWLTYDDKRPDTSLNFRCKSYVTEIKCGIRRAERSHKEIQNEREKTRKDLAMFFFLSSSSRICCCCSTFSKSRFFRAPLNLKPIRRRWWETEALKDFEERNTQKKKQYISMIVTSFQVKHMFRQLDCVKWRKGGKKTIHSSVNISPLRDSPRSRNFNPIITARLALCFEIIVTSLLFFLLAAEPFFALAFLSV